MSNVRRAFTIGKALALAPGSTTSSMIFLPYVCLYVLYIYFQVCLYLDLEPIPIGTSPYHGRAPIDIGSYYRGLSGSRGASRIGDNEENQNDHKQDSPHDIRVDFVEHMIEYKDEQAHKK